MNRAISPENPVGQKATEDPNQPRSIGQILEQHLDEIVGPELAARYRQRKENTE